MSTKEQQIFCGKIDIKDFETPILFTFFENKNF